MRVATADSNKSPKNSKNEFKTEFDRISIKNIIIVDGEKLCYIGLSNSLVIYIDLSFIYGRKNSVVIASQFEPEAVNHVIGIRISVLHQSQSDWTEHETSI